MKRLFFEISYDGTDFYGWQIQTNQNSIQGEIQQALTKLNSNQLIEIVGCGRTDAGVHAYRSVFHADFEKIPISDYQQFTYTINKMLPHSIAVHRIYEETKHARFDAIRRTYRYYIHQQKNPFKERFSSYFNLELDVDKMNQAALCLIGIHDFTTFSKANTDVKTHICEVFEAKWHRTEDGYYFEFSANRFLRNMVRATVGTLFQVGLNKVTIAEFQNVLKAQDRSKSAASAPANGLSLWRVEY